MQGPRHYNLRKNFVQEARSKRKTCLTNELSSPELGLMRLPGVPSIASQIAQEEGRVLEMAEKRGFCNNLTEIAGVLNVASRIAQEEEGGLCWERGPL